MLVLARKVNERIVITSERDPDLHVEIVVSKFQGDRVLIGVDAPRHLRVWRKELTHEPPRKELGGTVTDGQ